MSRADHCFPGLRIGFWCGLRVLDAFSSCSCPQYDRLVEWKAKHGHTRVPFVAGELGWWVNTQRQSERKGRLLPKRKAKLDAIDFCFYPQERVRPLGGAGKGASGTGGGENPPGSPPEEREEISRNGSGNAHGGASAAAGVPSVAAGAAAICKKRKSDSAGAALGRRAVGASSPPRRPAQPVGAHPPCVASSSLHQRHVATHSLEGAPPPPPIACTRVLPSLSDGDRPEVVSVGALQRAASDGGMRAPGAGVTVGGGLVNPWGLPRVKTEVAGREAGPRRSTSWEAAYPGCLASSMSPTLPGALPSVTSTRALLMPCPHGGSPALPRLDASRAVQQPAPLRKTAPLPPFRAFGEPIPPVAVRAVPVQEQQPLSPLPTLASEASPPSPSDRFLVRPRSPASSSSSSSSYAGIDMGHHRRVPLPASSYVPPQGIPSLRYSGNRTDVPAEQTVPGQTLAASHTTSTGGLSPPPPAVPTGRPLFPSLPLPPPASLLGWSGAGSGVAPLSPPVLATGSGVASPTNGSRRPAPPKLPPFSSLLSGTARGVHAPVGLTPTTSTPLYSGTAGRVATWPSASTRGHDEDGEAVNAATFPVGSFAANGGSGARQTDNARLPAPPPSGPVLFAAPHH